MTVEEDFDIPDTGAVFTFGKSRFADNAPSKFWIKNDMIVEISCGDEHTAVVTETGRVFMIGSNDMGQLGLGSIKPVSKPSCVKSLKPEKALHIACGRCHSIVACASGAVFLWGHNSDGQLGTGDHHDRLFPVQVLKLDAPAAAVAAGSSHSLVLTEGGEVYIWGGNREGQIGLDVGEQLTPTLLPLPHPAVSVACGYYHTATVTATGQAYTWGESEHGKLGLSDSYLPFHRHPQEVPLPEKIVQVAAGIAHTLFLSEGGGVYSCGLGSSGELGQGGGEVECWLPQPVLETNTQPIVAIAAGDNHSSAITVDGFLLTWGCGRHGKLCQGEENFASQFTPVIVRRLRHIKVVLVGCGGCHTMVLGYRRPELEEAEAAENGEVEPQVVTGPARSRRRVMDGVLPPLKSVGLPPVTHTVLPTVPDAEDHPIHEIQEESADGGMCNGVGNEDSDSEGDQPDSLQGMKNQFIPEKKSGRIARFFGLGRKKSSQSPQSPPDNEDSNQTTSVSPPTVEEDAELESIGEASSDGSDGPGEVVEGFATSTDNSTIVSSNDTSNHKRSKACVIL